MERGTCFSCSSTEHFKDACPYRGKGSASAGDGGSKGKGSKGGKKGSEEQPKGDAGAAADAAQTAAKVEDTARQDMFREVTAAIKQLTQTSSAASVKAIAVGVCPTLEGLPYPKPQAGRMTGLIDSGATLCVRPRREGEEPVEWRKVALAEGETYMGVSAFGTLIGSVDSEPIVSMSKLVRLGFHVAWRHKTCTVVHPTLGRVPVVVQDGCPRVDRQVALDLIARIEQWENDAGQQSTMNAERVALIHEAMQGMGVADYAEGLCRAIELNDGGEGTITTAWTEALLKTMYPDVPSSIRDEVSRFLPGLNEALCWNRRKRRSMHQSKGVILNLCCGSSRRQFQPTAARYGFQIVDVDVKENLNSPHTMAYLLRLAASGKVKGVLSRLPDRTWDIGSFAIRSRSGVGRWGLESASAEDRSRLFHDNCLLLRVLMLKVVSAKGLKMKFGDCPLLSITEAARDPQATVGENREDLPSVWCTPEWEVTERFLGVGQYHFNQGPLGHEDIKPTTIAAHGVYWPLWIRDILDNTCYPNSPTKGETHEHHEVRSYWALGLKQAIADAITNMADVWKRYRDNAESLKALAKRKVRTSFKDHIAQGHIPFRADCQHCLEGRLRGRPHQRQPAAESFVLSLDLMGPHKGGTDETLKSVRYFVVAVYTFPECLVGGIGALPENPDEAPAEVPNEAPAEAPHDAPAEVPNEAPAEVLDEAPQEWEVPEAEDPEQPPIDEPPVDLSEEQALPKVPMIELVWTEPLYQKTESETLRAVKRIEAQIALLGLPVARVHTDAGREFCNKGFRGWCSDQGFVKSCTGADDFRSNGRVENVIGVLKGRARTLLRASGLGWQDWAFAVRHCTLQHRSHAFHRLGWKAEPVKPFNSQVHIQERSWKAKEWGFRAVPARVLAPAKEVENAYVVRLEDGSLRNAKVIISGVRAPIPDEAEAPADAEVADAPIPPPRRRRHKSPSAVVDADSVGVVRKLTAASRDKLRTKHAQDETASFLAGSGTLNLQQASSALLASSMVLEARQGRTNRSSAGFAIVLGAYSRGGLRGISACTTMFPGLTALAIRMIKDVVPTARFTSIACLAQTCAPAHKDKYNLPQNNIVIPLEVPSNGGGIWIEDCQGDDVREVKPGLRVRGRVVTLQQYKPLLLNPHRWHSSEPWTNGNRVLLVGFSVKGSMLLSTAERKELGDAGFPLPFEVQSPEMSREGGEYPNHKQSFSVADSVFPKYVDGVRDDAENQNQNKNQKIPYKNRINLNKHVSFAEVLESVVEPSDGLDVKSVGHFPAPAGVGAGSYEVGVREFQVVDPAPAGEIRTCLGEQGLGWSCSACRRDVVGLCSVCERDVTKSAGFGSGPPNNNESVAAAPVRDELPGQRVNGSAGALDAETGGFDDALEVPWEASLAAPVRNTLPGQRVDGSGGVLDVGTGGFDAHDDGILVAPGVDLMRFCGDDCEAMGVGEFGGFDWGVDSVVLEASEFGFPDGSPQSGDDESRGSVLSAGFEDCESRALCLNALIARESKTLSREPEGSDDRDVSESTLVSAVRKLLQAQDEAAARVPADIEYSLLPDCEVLSTHTVPLPEVYKYFSRWRGSAEAELYSLIDDKKAFKRITLADIRRFEAEGIRVTIVPGKAIFTRKSGGRYKTRIVICGNFVAESWGEDGSGQEKASLYAAGCEVAHVRQIAARGARGKWAGFILDIKTAFLNSLLLDPFKPRTAPAPTLTDNPTELIAVRPPKILVAHDLADKNEFYLCLRAVYGLPQSPRDWGITRDQTITDMRISVSLSDFSEVELSTLDPVLRDAIGRDLVLVPSAADSQVWSLRLPNVGKDGEPGPALAWIAVYVDDIFIMGPRAFALAIVNKVKSTWETGSVQEIPEISQGTAAFFGIEFAWKGDQLLLGQQGYIRDLQTRYPRIKMQSVPLPPGNIDIPELCPEERDPSALKSCQGMLGEALWIAVRTRPDLMFAVSKLASSMSRNPTGTLPYVEHLLGYVFNTVDTVLAYGADDRTQELSCGVAPEASHHLIAHTDSSFAPVSGRSHECAILYQDGCLVTWLSSRQPFTAQSTAEAELLSTMSGYQLGRAHQYLASELVGGNVRLTVLSDNKAALQIITVDNASWRTRHLRIRAAALKEEFQADNVGIGYVPGVSNGADLGTKSVPLSRLRELLAILGLSSLTCDVATPATASSARVHTSTMASLTLLLCVGVVEGTAGRSHENNTHEWEFWALLGIVAVCSIVLWEGAKWLSRKLAQGFRVLSSARLFLRSADEPEAEAEVLSEAQPGDEDDLTEVVDPPPRPLVLHPNHRSFARGQ